MKTSFKYFALLFVNIMLCVSQAWGAEGDTHDFAPNISTVLNNSAKIPSFNISAATECKYPIKQVSVSWNYNQSIDNAVTINVSVGGDSWGSVSVGGKNTTTTVFDIDGASATGDVVVSFTNHRTTSSGNGTFKVTNVQLTEGSSGPIQTYTVTYHTPAGVMTPAAAENVSSVAELPSVDAPQEGCDQTYTFVGWISSSTYIGTPTIYKSGAKFIPTDDTDLYAVYGYGATPSATDYAPISSISELNAGEKVILWCQNKVLNTGATATDAASPANPWKNPAAGNLWTLEESSTSGKWCLKDGSSYLSSPGQTSGSTVGTGKTYKDWTIEEYPSHEGYFRISIASSVWLEYYGGFKLYGTGGAWDVYAFKIYAPVRVYTNFTTSPNCSVAQYRNYLTSCETAATLVTFNSNGGLFDGDEATCRKTYSAGDTDDACGIPVRAGHTFEGFTLTQDGTDYLFDSDGHMVNRSGYITSSQWDCSEPTLQLYAKWTIHQHTLTWDFDGGVTTSEESAYTHGLIDFNTPIVAPADPTKDGFRFTGWSTTPATKMPDEDVTYTAQWTAVYYDHFFVNGTKVDAYMTEHVDGKVAFPAATPTSCDETNYPFFVGWSATDFESTATAPALIEDGAAREPGNYYAVFAAGTPGNWERVSNVSQLTAGKQIIFGYEADHTTGKGTIVPARNEAPHTNNYILTGTTSGSSTSGTISMSALTGEESYTYVLRAGNSSGYFALENASGKYIGHLGKNAAKQYDAIDTEGKTDFSFAMNGDAGEVTITNKYGSENKTPDGSNQYYFKWLGYNTSNPRFAIYRSEPTRPVVYAKSSTTYTEWITRCCEQPGTALSISGEETVAYDTDLALGTTGGNGGTVVWSVTPDATATVSDAGVFHATQKGTYTVTASQDRNGSACATEAQKTVTVTAPLSSIAVTGQTTTCYVSQSFVFDGTCTATYADGSEEVVDPTEISVDVAQPFAEEGVAVATISYTEDGVTKSTTVDLTITTVPIWTITLNACGGTLAGGAPSTMDVLQSNPSAILPSCDPTCVDGHDWEFAGWSTALVPTTVSTTPATMVSSEYTATGDVTLYAVYSYVGVGGSGGSTTDKTSFNTGGTMWSGLSNYNNLYNKTISYTVPEGTSQITKIVVTPNNAWGSSHKQKLLIKKNDDVLVEMVGDSYTTDKTYATAFAVTPGDVIKFQATATASSTIGVKAIAITRSVAGTTNYYNSIPCGATTALTLDKNNGSADCYCTATYGSSTTECSNTTRTGYTLDGYTITLDGDDYVFNAEGTMQANTAVTDADGKWASVAEEMTLYAHWTPIIYNITYNLDGGTNGANPATYTIESADISLNVATKTGYTFEGWYSDEAKTQKVTSVAITHGSTGDKEFWANWTVNSYTFTLDKNTGEADGTMTINYDATAATSITNATKTGYTLQGYNSTAGTNGAGGGTRVLNTDGTIASNLSKWVADGKWIHTNEADVLYAAWKANTYQVRYNANEGTGSMANTSFTYDKETSLRKNTFTRTGYTFQGWATTAEGAVAYTDQQSVQNLTDVNNAIVDLYAVWAINQFDVTYHHAGANHVEPVDYNSHSAGFTPDECAADRVFVGWSESEVAMQDAEPALVDPTTFSITAAKEFYAVYASKNGGKAGSESVVFTDGFEGASYWNYTDGEQNSNAAGSDRTSKDGSGYGTMFTNSMSLMKSSQKFISVSKITADLMITGGKSNYRYAIQYSADGSNWTTIGGERSFANNKQYESVEAILPSVQDGYIRFATTTLGGTTKYYLCIDNVKVYQSLDAYVLTDYSTSCTKASGVITWEKVGGEGVVPSANIGDNITLPSLTRGCYNFTGWKTSLDGKTYQAGETYLFNHDVTMTAQWSVNAGAEVTVTYHTGLEGAETVMVENVHCGDVLTLVQVPEPAACGHNVFAGWAIGEFANTDNLSNIAQKYVVGTDVVMGDMELHAIWKNGKSDFTKINTDGDPGEGTYILVDPASGKALSATLAPTPVTIADNKISTDEAYIQWEVVKTAKGYSIQGLNGYLNITADATRAMGISDAVVDTWNIAESSTNGVYNLGMTFGASDRRVCYNSKHNKWFSYKNRTSGNLYKLTGDGPSVYTMDGVCPHIYHATTIEEMTSGKDVSVLAKENGMIIVENTSVVPVAQKVSGDDVFTVTINPTSTGANGDGSLNYSYSVKFTPTAGNQTYTATYKFIGTDETEDAKHIASEAITFTGYSLPDEFAIVVNRGGQYYALPGGIASASTPNAVAVTVVDGEVIDLGSSDAYHIHTGAVTGEIARTTLRLVTSAGALWATKAAGEATINNYSGDLTSTSAEASTTLTQWTLERYYRESDDEFMGYHLSSDANAAKGLFYKNDGSHWGYYNTNYYGGSGYNGEIFFLPIAAQFGDLMDIVEWNASSVVLNMNGYGATNGKWGVKNASDVMLLSGDRAGDRTLKVSTAALVADQYLNIKVYGNATGTPVVESNRNYKIPHIMEGTQSIASAASFSATSILYVKSGVTTVNVNLTVAKVVVCPGAELVVASDKTLTTTDLVLRGRVWTYEQPKLTVNGTLTVNGQTYYTRIVADKTAYYPFGLPRSSSVAAVRLSNGQTVTYGETSNWNLRYYDGQQRADRGNNTVSDWKNLTSGTIAAKTYYIMGSGSAYYREYYFPIDLNEDVDNIVAIEAYQGASAPDNGWNGFATPYTDVYTNRPTGDPSEYVKVTEKVENNTQWWQHVPDYLYPFFPYFFQTEAAGTLTFGSGLTFEVPAGVAARAKAEEEVKVTTQWVQLFLENERGEKDETNLYVHPTKFTVDYETGYDVAKMSMTGDRPMVWTKMACGNLAFNAIPDSIAENRIPVGVNAGIGKKMNFTLGTMNYLDRVEAIYLIDEIKGSTINLMDSDYEWEASDGVENRFYLQLVLKHAPQQGTGINQITGGERDKVRKIFYEEKLYIIRNGKMYDATGKAVR